MKQYEFSADYNHPLLAELYDREENYSDDIRLIRELIGTSGSLKILECFSGTGRIVVPLAQDGHHVTGIDIAPAMTRRAFEKIEKLDRQTRERVELKEGNIFDVQWGSGYDVVLLSANALYELPSAKKQERCFQLAREALRPGGFLFVDSNDYKGDWGKGPFGEKRMIFEGTGADGTYGCFTMENVRYDDKEDVLYMKRNWLTRTNKNEEHLDEYIGVKHPVRATEIEGWLQKNKFTILNKFGDREKNPYTKKSSRVIFWVQKNEAP